MKRLLRLALLGGCLGLLVQAADWPQWRGPQRDGISQETGLLREWPAGGPPLVWKATGLGDGYASVAVVEGRVFTQGQRGRKSYVIALSEETGAELWSAENGGGYRDRRGNGPRGTPTVDGDRVYALAAEGSLIVVEASTGTELWNTNLLRRFNARNIGWGISESPLIDGDRLLVNPGGGGASVVALNKNNGSVLWKSQSDEAGYSSAVVAEVGGVRQYVFLTGEAGLGVRAADGELLWRYEKVSNRTANVATPIVHDGHVYLSSDYGTGCALLKLTPRGDRVDATEVYFNRDMKNHYSSSVLVGDYLYGYSSRALTCMDFKTGKVLWRDRSVGKGQVTYVDGLLFLQSEDGVVGLADATPEGYRERSRFELSERSGYRTWTLPVVANGRLYVRDQNILYCYRIVPE